MHTTRLFTKIMILTSKYLKILPHIYIAQIGHSFLLQNEHFDEGFDVILGKCTKFREIKWQFPKIAKCPMDECRLSCSSRSIAFIHFCEVHANTSMACNVCDKLFSATNPSPLLKHYRDHHPNGAIPNFKPVISYTIYSMNV